MVRRSSWAALFLERMDMTLTLSKYWVKPSWQVYDLIANGSYGSFKGVGVNQILKIMVGEGEITEEEAESLVDLVDNILEQLAMRGDERATKEIIGNIEKLTKKAIQVFRKHDILDISMVNHLHYIREYLKT